MGGPAANRVRVEDQEEHEVREDDADAHHRALKRAVAARAAGEQRAEAEAGHYGLMARRVHARGDVHDELHDLELREVALPPGLDLDRGQRVVLRA